MQFFSIYQPHYTIFKLSDSLTLLASGKVRFYGRVQETLVQSESAGYESSNFDCCLQYTEKILHPKFIVGFTQQLANEACDINAVILYTRRRLAVCADPKKNWVKQAVHILSQRVKKM
ncbi:hypothetical protein E2I00_003870 [Balaenoptera physalus]|uniref:C-C motif chemokine n=1 Tax=Balaenoptera physalus TaxID=9770 RepID=A0A643C3H6_BALPH|nr:hypothetical protein E2I00_003870 [Balaenoptera physalus]